MQHRHFFITIFLVLLPTIILARGDYHLTTPDSRQLDKGLIVYSEPGDTLAKIAKRYHTNVRAIRAVNDNLPNKPKPWRMIAIPPKMLPNVEKQGIVINTTERKLYYFPEDSDEVYIYPVAVGRTGWETPTGKTRIIEKEEDPIWKVPKSIREYSLLEKGIELPEEVPPGPDNPLGSFMLRTGLDQGSILIHGNNNERSIGRPVSSGCIRMHNEDIEELFPQVEKGTPVRITRQATNYRAFREVNWLEQAKFYSDDIMVSDYNQPGETFF